MLKGRLNDNNVIATAAVDVAPSLPPMQKAREHSSRVPVEASE
jgi:hypothetical protein